MFINEIFYKLQEMANSNKEVARKLDDQSEPVCEHLVKYFYINNEELRSHWVDEIYSFLHRTDLLKSTKKLPSPEFIMKYTYNLHYDSILLQQEVILDGYNYNEGISDEHFNNFMKAYFEWLSEKLSNIGRVSRNQISIKLKELLEEYR